MPDLSHGDLIKTACPFLTVTAHKRNGSTFLEKLRAILHLPVPDPDLLRDSLNVYFFHIVVLSIM